VHSGPKHKFSIFLHAEGWRNALKHSQTSFWVQWSRMDALQLRYLEIAHSGPKHKFCIFEVLNVSEMLWNTPKSHFRSNGVECMFYNFGAPKYAFWPETQVLHLFTCRRLAKWSETHPNMILGTMESNGCFTTSVPKICIQARNTSFASFYVSKVSEMLWNTPKHDFGYNGVEWMLYNFGTQNVHSGPKHKFFIFLRVEG
jgi:hypothetical protein